MQTLTSTPLPAPVPPPDLDGGGLSTLNRDGSRRWLCPRPSPGRFLSRRRILAWVLIAVFTAIPYTRLHGRPLVLLDIAHREFTLFGATFLPTDTALFSLVLIAAFVLIFLLTALFGRVWCGWACPQTVYLEFVYRPLERLLVGIPGKPGLLRNPMLGRAVKLPVFLLVSMFLAHTFLAYFVGVEALLHWVRSSPFDHPASFLVMASTTALMLFDFGYFREQVCIVACPYGRLQSVMLDRQSLIISYDRARGEPRGKTRRKPPKKACCGDCANGKAGRCTGGGDGHHGHDHDHDHDHGDNAGGLALRVLQAPVAPEPRLGDCIDCRLCVSTCPTGIDIRSGLQMECIGCAQCIDACDAVMRRVGRAPGLIRYSTQARMEGERGRVLRPRVIIYPVLLAAVVGLFIAALATRSAADVSILRGPGMPFNQLGDGTVTNQVKVKVVNRTREAASYRFEVGGAAGARLEIAENPMPVPAGASRDEPGLIVVPRSAFVAGACTVDIAVSGGGFSKKVHYKLLGPAGPGGHEGRGERGDDHEHE